MKEKKEASQLSRRKFLKASTAVGIGTAIAGYSSTKNPLGESAALAKSFYTKEHEDFPIETNEDFERFDANNHIFFRGLKQETPELAELTRIFAGGEEGHAAPPGKIGYTEIDSALAVGGWSVTNTAAPFSQYGVSNSGIYSWEGNEYSSVVEEERKTYFDSPEVASKYIKRAAQIYSADLCGIAKYDERWTYTEYFDPRVGQETKIDFPFKPKYTIVLAHAMDYEGYKCSPSFIEAATTANMYSDMATRTYKLATFIRRLGYNAIPCGNDTAISIACAIDAGLGELSRMGLLITEKYGPRVRLTKIFTDLELKTDKPITFGVHEFCKVCMKCADNCPSGAISKDDDYSYKTNNVSNMNGVNKWVIDAEKCFKFWAENNCSCGNGIATCPYNKLEEWQHDFAKLATITPGVRSLAREFDELFGYGKVFDEKAYEEFWVYKED